MDVQQQNANRSTKDSTRDIKFTGTGRPAGDGIPFTVRRGNAFQATCKQIMN